MISQNFKTFLFGFFGGIIGALVVVFLGFGGTLTTIEQSANGVFTTQSVDGKIPPPPTKDDLPDQRDALTEELGVFDAGMEEQIDADLAQQAAELISTSEQEILDAEAKETNEIANNPELANRLNEPFITTCGEGEENAECVVAGCNATDIPQEECEALLDLYTSTNGKNWENTKANNKKWFGNNSACSWHGITCEGWHVSILNLYGNELAGTIPSSVSKLAYLKEFRLSNNQLTGPIPLSLSTLKHLQNLFIYANKLSGPIPAAIGTMKSLQQLLLNNNQLSGPIPASLGNQNLYWIDVHSNQLSGPLPESLSKQSNVWLDASYNQLSGPIPSSYGTATRKNLYLRNNQLCGKVPSSFMTTWPNGIKYWSSFFNNKLITTGYEPDMTTWLKKTKFYFGTQISKECDTVWNDSEEISLPNDK